jgi:hypothetical protein
MKNGLKPLQFLSHFELQLLSLLREALIFCYQINCTLAAQQSVHAQRRIRASSGQRDGRRSSLL